MKIFGLNITRAAAPTRNGKIATRKSYDAAQQSRLTTDWIALSRMSADAELQGKLPIIRERSRDLERNDPYGENFLRLAENNVIGSAGIGLQMKVAAAETEDPSTGELTITLDHSVNRAIERAWKLFCRRKNFLVSRNMSATAAFKLIIRTILRDGDCLIRKVRGAPNEFGFALQLFEADYLDDTYIDFRGVQCNCPSERTLPDGRPFPYCQSGMHEVRMGVELHGDWKFPVAYWLLAAHPGDVMYGTAFLTRRMRVPVEEIIHPFITRRIGQTRGVPAMVSAMLRLQMLGGYIEAELVAARCAAQKMGFIETEIPDSVADQFFDPEAQQPVIDSAPGQIEDLGIGRTFKEWDPKHPNQNMPGFNKEMLRGYGAGTGVSYTALANDIENVNFSSIRAGLLEEREVWKSLQRFFIDDVVMEIFEPWLPMAMLTGSVDVPFARLEDCLDEEAVLFKARRWPWVDPAKDVAAAQSAIDLGIKTRSSIIAEGDGTDDFDQVTAELEREKKKRDAAGLKDPAQLAADAKQTSAPPPATGG
jgi:lambda family phage portal protein